MPQILLCADEVPFIASLFPAATTGGLALESLLVLAGVIAYLPVFHAGFIWDDDLLLTSDEQMLSAQRLTHIWPGQHCCDYTSSLPQRISARTRLWGQHPVGYHILNVILHAAAGVPL